MTYISILMIRTYFLTYWQMVVGYHSEELYCSE